MRSAWPLLLLASPAVAQEPRTLDDFEEPEQWTVAASDQVSASLRAVDGQQDKGVCLDYDFRGVSGHAAMRRAIPLEFPPDYEFRFDHRGTGPANTFCRPGSPERRTTWASPPSIVSSTSTRSGR